MPDRKKVITAIERCSRWTEDDCNGCPYDGECMKRPYALESDVLALLREQEAVKPIEKSGFYYCGACRYALMTNHKKYCSDCGKAVKWDD